MSEELLQSTPHALGRYRYYRLGASTISQLNQAGIIAGTPSSHIRLKRPDGLVALDGGAIKAYVEYKPPSELNTDAKVQAAIQQEIEPAAELCNLLIVSDGQKTFWVNPHTGNEAESASQLPVFNVMRIVDGTAPVEYLRSIERVVDQADQSLTAQSDELRDPSLVDPSNLARTIWQKIWINTGKEPEKCLYNVVELFVFKFLSDLSVLRTHHNFASVCRIGDEEGHDAALDYYARISRPAIHRLFPEGDDGTTVINGTIFINEQGEANPAQARLFLEVMRDLREFDRTNGSFKYISKEFKTRLYESFLRQGAGLHHLGQFFTPRNVVQAMVQMSGANALPAGESICDPFCGVGGFLLETILESPQLAANYEPVNGKVTPSVRISGYDRGSDEKEDERTIILAKANALIYFSDLIARYNTPAFLEEFACKVVNQMFSLVRSNLGTFAVDDANSHDLILTNPPYVTRGSRSLKDAITEAGIADRYPASGRGTESLALQWAIRSLKPGGAALMVVPDGLLNQRTMLEFVKEHCIVKGIISLPTRTFYATTKKTYVLAFERKFEPGAPQNEPVFAYLTSEIGETRDANRWTVVENKPVDNDLVEAVGLFNQFKGSPATFVSTAMRCKVVEWSDFDECDHWMLDRFCWTDAELQEIGVQEVPAEPYTVERFNELLQSLGGSALEFGDLGIEGSMEVFLGDESLFELRIGKRVLKRDCVEEGVPCISANVNDVFGYIPESTLIHDFDVPSLTWSIDGNFDWYLIEPGIEFHPTDHCGVLRVLHEEIDAEYLFHTLKATKEQPGFDRTYRANLGNVARIGIAIPTTEDGSFDLNRQQEIARMYQQIDESRERLLAQLERIANAQVAIV